MDKQTLLTTLQEKRDDLQWDITSNNQIHGSLDIIEQLTDDEDEKQGYKRIMSELVINGAKIKDHIKTIDKVMTFLRGEK